MIQVAPHAQFDLEHSAAWLAVSGEAHIAAISQSGSGTFFAPSLTRSKRFSIPASIRSAELSQGGDELAVTSSTGITVYSTETFEKSDYLNDAFESCLYAPPDLFWTCSQFGERTKVVEVRHARTKARIARKKFADPFSGGGVALFSHLSPGSAVILVGGGQDGQRLFWATLDGDTIQVKRFEDLDFACQPAFSPNGREFLVGDGERLVRYSYPDGPLLGAIDELAGEPFGYGECVYLDQRRALVNAEGRLFVVNAERMEVVDELGILGFEDCPMSPFQSVRALPGNTFVSVHGDPGAEMRDNWIHLVLWSPRPE